MKKALILLVIAGLITIQFFRPPENTADAPFSTSLQQHYEVPAAVQTILETACYDCHSENTDYPGYFKIQPIAWWMNYHIREGKKQLNFDRFYRSSLKRQDHQLKEIIEMLQQDKMPLKSYRLLHEEARLTEGQKQKIIDWARQLRESFVIPATA